jgi:hypothetical protein
MAIKVGGVSVINNSIELENLSGASGTFSDFHPSRTLRTSAATLNLSMLDPVQQVDMTSNVAFTITDKNFGRDATLILDTTATPYTPSFDSAVEFPGGEPTWSTYRHWVITFLCWNSTNVRATAIGYADPGTASTNLPSTFSQDSNFDTWQVVNSTTNPQCWCAVSFEHEPSNNRIKVGWWSGDSTAMSSTQYTYVNYTGLTNITSCQFQYNVGGQSCSGMCTGYSSGPTPPDDGYSSGTYYNGFVRFWWVAEANSTTTNTSTSATFDSANPDFRIRIICDQGTLYSTCELTATKSNSILCQASYGTQKSV